MASIQYYDVIIRPVITEKSMADMGEKKYTFLVHPEANKTQIKEAVEKMFSCFRAHIRTYLLIKVPQKSRYLCSLL